MENKNTGLLIIGISVVIAIIVLIFNSALSKIAGAGCGHTECTMEQAMVVQTWVSLIIAGVIFLIGLMIMLAKPKEKVIIKRITERKKKIKIGNLEKDEKEIVDFLISERKAVFQADLMEKLDIGKVKTTRLLDKLESKGIIERKRRGMNNIVVLKD